VQNPDHPSKATHGGHLIDWARRARELPLDGRPFIDGRRDDTASAECFTCINPQDGQVVAQVPRGAQTETDRAVAAARAALSRGSLPGEWAPRATRAAMLARLADAVQAHGEELALLDSLCMGIPAALGVPDLQTAATQMQETAQLAQRLADELLPSAPTTQALALRMPHGVVAAITPWNFPVYVALGKIVPALAMGNSLVLKPSELASLGCLRLGELAAEAGVPPGVFSVVTGRGPTCGRALALHADVDCLSFTGSTATGGQLMACAGQSNLKALLLECGGKSPQIVFDDFGNLAAVADALVQGFTWNSGQVCVAGSRILVHRPLRDRLAQLLEERMHALHTGDPLEASTTLGPLASAAQWTKVNGFVREALSGGARALGAYDAAAAAACHIRPLVVDGVGPDAAIVQEEVFGPVATLQAFDTLEQALALANGTRYGLAASAWVEDEAVVERLARGLRAGMVTLMAAPQAAPAMARGVSIEPVGLSGFGAEGGRAGLLAYTRARHVSRLLA